jgi:glycosyltransferase involved in cell wall biosynthesis
MPKFSIIATDYENHVPRDGMRRGLKSLLDQTFDDYELIIVHDGPKEVPYSEEVDLDEFNVPIKIINTPKWLNQFGHPSRDFGMKYATGDYFIHFNIDNFLYPECLKEISDKINKTKSKIVIFSIKHFKWDGGRGEFTGVPPIVCNIDGLQLVAHHSVWQMMGGWYDNSYVGDGIIYERMCKVYPWVHINKVLAENY